MDRMRDSIGELMSDEDLKKIVERGVEAAIFTGKEYGDSWNRKKDPSLIEKAVTELLSMRMKEAVDIWVKENPEKLEKAVADAIALGAGGCMMEAMNQKFQGAMMNLQHQIFEIQSKTQ